MALSLAELDYLYRALTNIDENLYLAGVFPWEPASDKAEFASGSAGIFVQSVAAIAVRFHGESVAFGILVHDKDMLAITTSSDSSSDRSRGSPTQESGVEWVDNPLAHTNSNPLQTYRKGEGLTVHGTDVESDPIHYKKLSVKVQSLSVELIKYYSCHTKDEAKSLSFQEHVRNIFRLLEDVAAQSSDKKLQNKARQSFEIYATGMALDKGLQRFEELKSTKDKLFGNQRL
ncbi:hypothetical protein BDR22DRAFT_821435 [Usnea florida]